MASGGFVLVVNYNQFYGSADQEVAYAKRAARDGMQVIWNFSDPAFRTGDHLLQSYPDLAKTCGCNDEAGFVAYIVGLVRDLPGTWGYYIGDEVPERFAPETAALSAAIRAADPVHPQLIVGIGSTSLHTTRQHLDKFARSADVLAVDHYPVSTGQPISSVAAVAQNVQTVATAYGKGSGLVLQSFNWGEYPKETWVCTPFPTCAHFPTERQMRTMRDDALANAAPALILWYSFFDVLRSKEPVAHWNDLVQAAGADTLNLYAR